MILTFDFETTGRDPRSAIPVSVAVVEWRSDGPHRPVWASYVDPGVPIPLEASEVHGVTSEHVRGAPGPSEVAARLATLFEGARAVAAHNAIYDATIYRRYAPEAPEVPWLCTLTWSRSLWWGERPPWPTLPEDVSKRSLTLSALAHWYGLDLTAHDAGADAGAVAAVLTPLMRSLRLAGYQFGSLEGLARWTASEAGKHAVWLASRFGGEPLPWSGTQRREPRG